MSLPTSYTQAYGTLEEFFDQLRDAQAPDKFTHQMLKDWGYKSNNHRPFIPLLKALGFLTSDGSPTPRYHEYRNHAESKTTMGQALKEAYSDVFLIKSEPSASDRDLIQGKFKSYHNCSDNVAKLHASTFYALLELADLSAKGSKSGSTASLKADEAKPEPTTTEGTKNNIQVPTDLGLHYNIQIHLPATKDVEVYNAIFKSLKEHLVD